MHRSFAPALVLILAAAGCASHRSALPQLAAAQSISPGDIPVAPMVKTAILPSTAMQSPIHPNTAMQGADWTQIPGTASQVAASQYSSGIWVLSDQPAGPDKYIWHYINGTWTNISGLASRISVKGQDVYAINSSGGAYHYSQGTWTALGGGCRDLSIAADDSLYVVSNSGGADGAIWRYANGSWTQMPGSGAHVTASYDARSYFSASGTISSGGVFVLNSVGDIYYLSGSTYAKLPGAASAAAPATGGFFVLGSPSAAGGNAIYRYDLDAQNWSPVAGTAISIATGEAASSSFTVGLTELYAVSSTGAIYQTAILPSERLYLEHGTDIWIYNLPLTPSSTPSATFPVTSGNSIVVSIAVNGAYLAATTNESSTTHQHQVIIFAQPISSSSTPIATITENGKGQLAFMPDGNLFEVYGPENNSGMAFFTPPFSSSSMPNVVYADPDMYALTSVLADNSANNTQPMFWADGRGNVYSPGGVVNPYPWLAPVVQGMAANGSYLFVCDEAPVQGPAGGAVFAYTLPLTNSSQPIARITNGTQWAPINCALDSRNNLYVGDTTYQNKLGVYNVTIPRNATSPVLSITGGGAVAVGP